MQTTRTDQGHRHLTSGLHGLSHIQESHTVPPLLVLMVSLATGCGGMAEEPGAAWEPEPVYQELENGNGLSVNGLSVNGLSVNGLSTLSFVTWFQGNPVQADSVMRYLVLCAAPAGKTLTYMEPLGVQHTWSGSLGLAPGWASGLPPTVAEQQIVSACLAAHVNKYGVHISISVLGQDGGGNTLPYSSLELSTHSRKEACVFGNLFSGQGLFVGHDGGTLDASQSSTRVCTLGSQPGTSRTSECGPLTQIGSCSNSCTLDPSGTYYASCTYNGVTYQPLTTRVRPEDVYTCGDGICQVTESCGSSNTYDSCQADCGSCN